MSAATANTAHAIAMLTQCKIFETHIFNVSDQSDLNYDFNVEEFAAGALAKR